MTASRVQDIELDAGPRDRSFHVTPQRPRIPTKHANLTAAGIITRVRVTQNSRPTAFDGFPTERADDPLLDLVRGPAAAFPHAEERRLFYVAMTRTRRIAFLLTDEPSPAPRRPMP